MREFMLNTIYWYFRAMPFVLMLLASVMLITCAVRGPA